MARADLHDWLRPKVQGLLREAEAAGYEHDLLLAVLIDVCTGSIVNDAPLPAEPPSPSGPWAHDPDQDPVNIADALGTDTNMLGQMRHPERM